MSSAGEISGVKKGGRYVRDDLDFFVEPAWAVELLLQNEMFFGETLDPACGTGTIVHTLNRFSYPAVGWDIADRGQKVRRDFLEPGIIRHSDYHDNIICNPPFKLASPFIRKALMVARHKVAMLVQAKFLYSQARHALFTEHPPARIYHLSSRPSMPPGDLLLAGKVKATGGKLDYAWLVWSKDHKGPTTTHWLIRKADGKAKEKAQQSTDRGEQGGAETDRHNTAA